MNPQRHDHGSSADDRRLYLVIARPRRAAEPRQNWFLVPVGDALDVNLT